MENTTLLIIGNTIVNLEKCKIIQFEKDAIYVDNYPYRLDVTTSNDIKSKLLNGTMATILFTSTVNSKRFAFTTNFSALTTFSKWLFSPVLRIRLKVSKSAPLL